MPSTRPKDKYGVQMIILFAPDPDIRENAGMLLRGLNPLGWSDQGKTAANTFVIEWNHLRLAMPPRDAGAEDKEEFDRFKQRLAKSDGAGRIYLSGHGDWASADLGREEGRLGGRGTQGAYSACETHKCDWLWSRTRPRVRQDPDFFVDELLRVPAPRSPQGLLR